MSVLLIIIGYIFLGMISVLIGVVWFDIDEEEDVTAVLVFLFWPFMLIGVIFLALCFIPYQIGQMIKSRRE